MPELTSGQREATEAIASGKHVFLTGPGGTGKTYVFMNHPQRAQMELTATTGHAASHFRGKTLFSWAGMQPPYDRTPEEFVAAMSKYVKKRWKDCKVLLIDEASMLSAETFDLVDRIGRLARGRPSVAFGGLQLVLVGDLYQLPPVQGRFIFHSETFKRMFTEEGSMGVVVELTEIMRQSDTLWQRVLNKIRVGEADEEVLQVIRSRMVEYDSAGSGLQPTIVTALVKDVEATNEKELATLGKTQEIVKIKAQVSKFDTAPEFVIANLVRDCPLQASLEVAVGAQVMFTINLPLLGIHNGMRGVVEEITDEFLWVATKQGRKKVEKHSWDLAPAAKAIVKQFPLKLAWAITAHKCQGSTLDLAKIDLGKTIFADGQAYVALSRVKDLDGLFISDFDPGSIMASRGVKRFLGHDEPSAKKPRAQ